MFVEVINSIEYKSGRDTIITWQETQADIARDLKGKLEEGS